MIDSVEASFYKYRQLFIEETRHISSASQMYNNENYNKLINLGTNVVPLMIKDFQDGEYHHWFKALRVLTGVNPIKSQSKGFISKMAQDWIDYYRQQGVIK